MKSRIAISESEKLDGLLDPQTCQNAIRLFDKHGAVWIENLFDREFVHKLQKAYHKRYTSLTARELDRRHAIVGDRRYMATVTIEPPSVLPGSTRTLC